MYKESEPLSCDGSLNCGRFQYRICIASIITSASRERENKTLSTAMKKWEKLQLTLDNSKSEERESDF